MGHAVPNATFTGAVFFTMLHHVPSLDLQDLLLREACRVLQPGGIFAGTDSRTSAVFCLARFADTMVLVDPDTFTARLESAGFCRRRGRTGEASVSVPGTAPD